ncbi:MAG: ribonuclease T [Ectothiorhodospiraceae bacterium]|nr:ribonuclease T [Chromatiales bacterium]MCP5153977.1 ribonuclease T [Ectothiorhodospiraceae bacterium]
MSSPPDSRPGPVAGRFRGFLPVVVDVETGGFDARRDALLEIAMVLVRVGDDGRWFPAETHSCHVEPFRGANLDPRALEFNGIVPDHPLRMALPESEALAKVMNPVRREVKDQQCTRAVLVGHNPAFDLSFVNAAVERTRYKRNPFHPFATFDTATLAGLAFGQTVLARAVEAAGFEWDARDAHSAIYDAERTADLFCRIVNLWDGVLGPERARETDRPR